jgi:transcription elongation factor GreA
VNFYFGIWVETQYHITPTLFGIIVTNKIILHSPKGKSVQKEPMLRETYERLTEELERLKSVERIAIAKAIDEARALGDLKENAEYHAAKEKQGLMEARIIELTDLTGRAQVIDPSTLAHERVSFGSTVVLVNQATDEEVSYTIVGSQESDPHHGLISLQSPMARALIGKEEGDEVALQLTGGKKMFDIEEIKFVKIEIR